MQFKKSGLAPFHETEVESQKLKACGTEALVVTHYLLPCVIVKYYDKLVSKQSGLSKMIPNIFLNNNI